MTFKVGEVYKLIDPRKTNLSKHQAGKRVIIASLTYSYEYFDPEEHGFSQEDCVYGTIEGELGKFFFRKDCIIPLTKLEKILK